MYWRNRRVLWNTTWIAGNPTGTGFRFAIGVKPEIAESEQAPLTVRVHLILPASSVHHPRLTAACRTMVGSEKPRPARLACLAARTPNVAPPPVRIERLTRFANPMRAGNQRSKTLSVPGSSQRQQGGECRFESIHKSPERGAAPLQETSRCRKMHEHCTGQRNGDTAEHATSGHTGKAACLWSRRGVRILRDEQTGVGLWLG